jgi:hypothetical protein
MILNLTEKEYALLEHRITLWDALADCISDTYPEKFTWDETYKVASELDAQLRKQSKELGRIEIDVDKLTELQKEILQDCIDGSTFFASSEDAVASGEIKRTQLMAWKKMAYNIEKKFKDVGLQILHFPMH